MTPRRLSRPVLVGVIVLVQVLLVALAVSGQLIARVTGTAYLLRVAPVDPVDPFRGAYVQLGYPDLRDSFTAFESLPTTTTWIYVPLVQEGDHWRGGTPRTDRGDGPVLRCPRSASAFDPCGLGSFFLSEDRAQAAEKDLKDGSASVTVRIDDAGRAVLVDFGRGSADPLTPEEIQIQQGTIPTVEVSTATS